MTPRMLSSSLFRRDRFRDPQLLILLIPFFLLFSALNYAKTHFYRDPTSPYFDRSRAYARIYTKSRLAEADEFLAMHNSSDAEPFLRAKTLSGFPPFMCIGMNTIARPSGDVYARPAIGSMLTGLSQKERNQLYFMPMIGHINASAHPIYTEPWLEKVADRVLTYRTSELMSEEQFDHIQELELERQRTGVPDREKHMADYTHLLKVCAATKAPYVLMLEDDVLFLDGWFHRVRAAIQEVEGRAHGSESGWFYLRLFNLDHTWKWSAWERGYYTLTIALRFFVLAAAGYAITYHPKFASLGQKYGRSYFRTLTVGFFLTLYFFFTVGHFSMVPISVGVRELPEGGCCAQGIVYPNEKIEPLTKWYIKNRIGFVDDLAERLASEKPDGYDIGSRWSITPVVMQHIGGKSSKGDNWGSDKPGQMAEAQRLWNFGFEANDRVALAAEHRIAAQRLEGERLMGED